jgi:hypothetical protein
MSIGPLKDMAATVADLMRGIFFGISGTCVIAVVIIVVSVL